MDIYSYISSNTLILIPACWLVGMALKRAKAIRNNVIPLVLVILGAIGGVAIMGFNAEAVLQGILAGGASVGFHQVKKQVQDTEG